MSAAKSRLKGASWGPPSWSHFRSWDPKSFPAIPIDPLCMWQVEWLQRLVKHTFGNDEIHWVHCFRCYSSQKQEETEFSNMRRVKICIFRHLPPFISVCLWRPKKKTTSFLFGSFCVLCIKSSLDPSAMRLSIALGWWWEFLFQEPRIWDGKNRCMFDAVWGWSIANL